MKQKRQKKDDLEDVLPAFLRIPQAERNAAWLKCPPTTMQKGMERAEKRAITDPGTLALLAEIEEDKARKAKLREERIAERKAMRPKRISPLAGKVRLMDIVAKMKAPLSRRNARGAIDASSLEHMLYHFEPGDATQARVLRVLESYVPPVRRGGSLKSASLFAPSDVIHVLIKKNPRQEGSGAYERMQILMKHSGRTFADFVQAGGNPTTLKNAIAKKQARTSGDGASQAPAALTPESIRQTANADGRARARSRKKMPSSPKRKIMKKGRKRR